MTIKHTLNIFFTNFTLLYKVFIYFIIVAIIITAIASAALSPTYSLLKSEFEASGFSESVKDTFHKLVSGDVNFLESLKNAASDFNAMLESIKSLRSNLIGAFCILLAFVLIFIFIFRMAQLPFTNVINQFMSVGNRFGFLNDYVLDLKRSALYALFSTLIVFPISLGFGIGLIYLFFATFKAIRLFALPIIFIIWLLISSLKSTFFCGWLPAIVKDDKKLFEGLAHGFKSIKGRFGRIFVCYLTARMLLVIACGILSVFTFGAGTLITIPLCIVFLKTLELVIYYNCNDYNYYVDKDKVNTTSIYNEYK